MSSGTRALVYVSLYDKVKQEFHTVFEKLKSDEGLECFERKFSESEMLGLENLVSSKRRDRVISLLNFTNCFRKKENDSVLSFKDMRDKLNGKISEIKVKLGFKKQNNNEIRFLRFSVILSQINLK